MRRTERGSFNFNLDELRIPCGSWCCPQVWFSEERKIVHQASVATLVMNDTRYHQVQGYLTARISKLFRYPTFISCIHPPASDDLQLSGNSAVGAQFEMFSRESAHFCKLYYRWHDRGKTMHQLKSSRCGAFMVGYFAKAKASSSPQIT
jgi:hypothetical protein